LDRRWVSFIVRLALACAAFAPLLPRPARAQELSVDQIMDLMTTEEKVGQVFMVDFPGTDTSASSRIAQLIGQYKVGSVFVSESRGNINNQGEEPAARQVAQLTNSLQTLAYEASNRDIDGTETFLPLFIAVQQDGNGYPYTELRNGFTPLPSNMALGASWSEEYSQSVGDIVGTELSAVGVNMLLGPVVDVLEAPRSGGRGDLGVRVFGGNPDWVGRLARAYIRGVHSGSQGRVATVAKHFPGYGSGGRDPESEVSTINKTLDGIRAQDMVPFVAVTAYNSGDPLATTEGLLVGHIRCEAFQENMQFFSDPLTLDEKGLATAMALPEFETWHSTGLLVADFLGADAIKEHLNASRAGLPHLRIAREALMAGNNILPLVNFSLSDDWDGEAYSRIVETIQYFQERYTSDPQFRPWIDQSVRKILQVKLGLYGSFSLDDVLVEEEAAASLVGNGTEVVREIVADSLTLLYPGEEELSTRLPGPPGGDEDILILQCFEDCYAEPVQSGEALQAALIRLYGPDGTGQVSAERVRTLGFAQVADWMGGILPATDEEMIARLMNDADWVILALSDYNPEDFPASRAVRDLLSQREYYLGEKKVVAIAYDAPYHLDSTEAAKLTAYYAVYGKVPPSLEGSLRPLFETGFVARGASPVDVEAVGYEIASVLGAAPDQVIPLQRLAPAEDEPLYVGGDPLVVQTGVIVDRNGHAVPDGTEVQFRGSYMGADIFVEPQVVTDTIGGVAGARFWLSSAAPPGLLRISAEAGEASSDSVLVRVVVPVTPFPTPTPTATPTPTPTPTATPIPPTPTLPVPTPTPASTGPPPHHTRPLDWLDFLFAGAGTVLGSVAGLQTRRGRRKGWEREVQLVLYSAALGLIGYILYGLGLMNPSSILGWQGIGVRAFLLFSALILAFLPSALVWLRSL
jgi:beta-N-acetylhexosaminidase